MQKKFLRTLGLVALCLLWALNAQAGEVDVLLQKLVEKGILSSTEAQEVRTETNEEVAKQKKVADGEYAELAKKSMPDWVKNIKLKGDFRLRYQYQHTNDALNDRHRARIRLRLGAEGKVNDKLMVGVGIATGLNDGSADAARSTNATLENGFSKKVISLDYAYAKYTPYEWLEIIGGKFHNPLWMPSDLVWDSDINPEGGSINLKKKMNDQLDLFLNTGIFVLDESNSAGQNDDPMMYVFQPGFNYKATDKVSVKGAFSVNNSSNVKGRTLNGTASTNSTSGGGLKYDFIVLEPAAQVDIKKPFDFLSVPVIGDIENLSLFAQYVNNTIPSDENNGFAVGFKMGAKKVAKFGDWQFKYLYTMLEKDAVLDILPDSDRYFGRTGIRGHEGELTFGLSKNTFLGVDIYRVWSINNSKSAETLVQVDWNMKF